ncbi:ABC transporter permease [Actinomadura chibensis]|uniref:Transport permease protein n=1 Tax=Actinomadura chibensis TaxID=392828 RepID=A0A5D0NP96_9ACTN|nr:ABC transporter permease [Actinomadura chibensis]TYB46390.1 ABC transporter [Actinomadura chibensis]
MTSPSFAVLERHLLIHRRVWTSTALTSLCVPLLFLLSLGVGVGGRIGSVDGVPYKAWIAVPLLASTAFQQAAQESTFRLFNDLNTTRVIDAMATTPAGVRAIVLGRLLFIVVRVGAGAVGFLVIAGLFGGIRSWWIVAAPPVVVALTAATALPLTALTSVIKDDTYMPAVSRFVTIPLVLLSGIFFSIANAPGWVRPVVYASPLWHGVELIRGAALGHAPEWPVWAHLAVLAAWSALGYFLAAKVLNRRLYDGRN